MGVLVSGERLLAGGSQCNSSGSLRRRPASRLGRPRYAGIFARRAVSAVSEVSTDLRDMVGPFNAFAVSSNRRGRGVARESPGPGLHVPGPVERRFLATAWRLSA